MAAERERDTEPASSSPKRRALVVAVRVGVGLGAALFVLWLIGSSCRPLRELAPGPDVGLALLAGALLTVFFAALLWMYKVVTEPLDDFEQASARAPMRNLVKLGYGAMIFAVVLSLFLLTIPAFWAGLHSASAELPIGILRACRYSPGSGEAQPGDPLGCPGGSQWVLNIGGSVVAAEPGGEQVTDAGGMAITGGFLIPLYIIVFSLFGGAISMTRRLPEYQRRATAAYKAYYAEQREFRDDLMTPLEPYAVRENVVFQIMQTLSAPLIAATVYALLEPGDERAIVVIGFAAGFASEPILMQLRKLAEHFGGESYERDSMEMARRRKEFERGRRTPMLGDEQRDAPTD